MLGVPKELIEHILNVHPQAVPKKQHLRRFAHDKREAIKQEIAILLAAGFIKEVIHPEWVANPILVRKKNNEWRTTSIGMLKPTWMMWSSRLGIPTT
jgi:hypothetical protein